ncbi:hypothetical protein BD626DRAFT_583115 [Schizophyllum amplum]|uniref:MYND-type domain-containing protein n=1 Tax=Schizophyllum amplum TaxID=97359 RepID=A0A550CG26_9AGAR|nr:hypothetical protein BD626DRAFT_583115 [Auriculariopsis ampla]
MAATAPPQPRSATTAASTWEENVTALGNALYSIQSCQNSDYPKPTDALPQHLRVAKRLLKTRPLHVFLDPPPDVPATSYFRASPSRAITTIAALLSLSTLHSVAKDDLRALWPFDDSVWACALRWTAYFLPIHRDHSLDELPYLLDKGTSCFLMIAVLRIFESITTLPTEHARELLLSSGNNALCSVVALWALWPTIADELNADELRAFQPDLCCSRTFAAVWNLLERDVAQNLIGTHILRLVGGRERRVFRILAAHLRTTLSAGERGRAELNAQLDVIYQVAHKYEWTPQTLPAAFAAAVVAVLDEHLVNSPKTTNACYALLRIWHFCLLSDHFITLCLENGLFPLLVHIRMVCPSCSSGVPPEAEAFDSPGGTTGGLLVLIGDCLNARRAVRGFHEALLKFPARLPPIQLREDEQAVISIAQRRYTLLERAELEWESVAVCCNPSCSSARDVTLRACPCGEALYCSTRCQRAHWDNATHREVCKTFMERSRDNFLGTMRAKDLHFLVAITRAYIEENYAQIAGWMPCYLRR